MGIAQVQSSKKRRNSFDDEEKANDNKQKKGKNNKKPKEKPKKIKNKNSNLKEELNERGIFDISEKSQDPDEKDEKEVRHKSPEEEVIGEYENERPSIKIVERKTINNSTILIGLANIGATCYMNATFNVCLTLIN